MCVCAYIYVCMCVGSFRHSVHMESTLSQHVFNNLFMHLRYVNLAHTTTTATTTATMPAAAITATAATTKISRS